MSWLVYPSLSEAEAAQGLIWEAIKPPFEMRDGKAQPTRLTTRWADPQPCKEGWAIPSPEISVKGAGGTKIPLPTFPEQEMP